jgi:cyclase
VLCKRVISVLTFNDGVLFRTKLFEPDYRYTSNFVDAWSIDEIVMLDVTRPGKGNPDNFAEMVREFSRRCFVPLSVGGGIRTLADVERCLELGADKVVINTAALDRPAFIGEVAKLYGSQCVVVSIDVRRTPDDRVFAEFARRPTGKAPQEWARQAQDEGAGEILVSSVERDGSLQGYDLDLCRKVVDAVTIPVLICGGAGNWGHFDKAFTVGGASAVCTTNIYHFTESAIRSAKQYLVKAGIHVRT